VLPSPPDGLGGRVLKNHLPERGCAALRVEGPLASGFAARCARAMRHPPAT